MLGIIFSVFIILIIIIIVYRMLTGKGTPDNSYTPFDHITGQTSTEFKDEIIEEEQDK